MLDIVRQHQVVASAVVRVFAIAKKDIEKAAQAAVRASPRKAVKTPYSIAVTPSSDSMKLIISPSRSVKYTPQVRRVQVYSRIS